MVRTKLMEAYSTLIGSYPLDAMSATLLKEELEELLDQDLTDNDFNFILKENAKVYKIYLYKYKPEHFGFLMLDGRKVGEISIELKENSCYS